MANKTSQHILTTSANLLGFCLIIVTSLHLTNKTENSILDEFASVIALLLTLSTVLSFLSIRAQKPRQEMQLEKTADVLFLISVVGILGMMVAIIALFWLR
jgi:Mn2+/Fe2+ NRAMP family transporter